MNILINHCWCRDSIWGGQYNCRVIVSLEQYAMREDVYARKNSPDWDAILFELNSDTREETHRLKPEVIQWLNENVKDVREDFKYNDTTRKAWAVGSDKYNSTDSISFHLFFQRATDARKFIKRWSVHKNPVDYLNYFKDLRWKLDPATGKMKSAPR